ncbi:MAG: hypothetical protein WDM80_17775 [Limisphaerales bacterium]
MEPATAQSDERFLEDDFLFVSGVSLPFMGICIGLAFAGVFPKFWFWTFSYAWQYAINIPVTEGLGYLMSFVRTRFVLFIGFGILSAAGLVLGLRHAPDRKRIAFVLLLFAFSFLGTVPGFNFFPHYFVLMLPATALMAGMAAEFICARRTGLAKIILPIFPFAVLAFNVWLQWTVFLKPPPQALSRIIYGTNPFVEAIVVGDYIREHAGRDARVAVIGSEPEIYFYGRRHSGQRLHLCLSVDGKPALCRDNAARDDQRDRVGKPEFIVMVSNSDSWGIRKSSDMEILEWAGKYIAEHFECVGLVNSLPGTEPN